MNCLQVNVFIYDVLLCGSRYDLQVFTNKITWMSCSNAMAILATHQTPRYFQTGAQVTCFCFVMRSS